MNAISKKLTMNPFQNDFFSTDVLFNIFLL